MGLLYAKIFKQALTFAKTKKFLWSLGLFLIWSNVLAYLILAALLNTNSTNPNDSLTSDTLGIPLGVQQALGFGLIAISGLMFYLYIRSRAGLVLAVRNLMERKPTGFWRSIMDGHKYFLRLLSLWASLFLVVILSGLILSSPVNYLYAQNFNQRADLLAGFGLGIFIVTIFVLALVNSFAGMFIVLTGLSLPDAIFAAYDLVSAHWWKLVWFSARMIALSLLAVSVAIIGQALILTPFVFLSGLSYDIGGNLLKSPAIMAGLGISFIFFCLVMAVVSVFQHMCWTLVFMELVRPQKIEEDAEPEVAPEII